MAQSPGAAEYTDMDLFRGLTRGPSYECPGYDTKASDDGIGLHVNTDEIEHLCFNQRGDI